MVEATSSEYKTRKKIYNQTYYNKNKSHILASMGQSIVCDCGVSVRRDNINRHKRSEKHNLIMERVKA